MPAGSHSTSNHCHSWLGTGIQPLVEYRVAKRLVIRPIHIESDVAKLVKRANTQFDYGLLCAIAPTITFELETTSSSSADAAVECWNNQYALIFLSIVARTFVFHTIQAAGGYQDDPNQLLTISSSHGIPYLQNSPKVVSVPELEEWSQLLPNFTKLLAKERFIFAASIAANVYVHPRIAIQVASIFAAIEALLDIEQELRFRISLSVAKLAARSSGERITLLTKMKKLYDVRSKCVHGGNVNVADARNCRDASLEILRMLLLMIVSKGKLFTKGDLEELAAQ